MENFTFCALDGFQILFLFEENMVAVDDTDWKKEHLYHYVHKIMNQKNEEHQKSLELSQ